MIGKNKLKQVTDTILKLSKADETEVLIFASSSALTRFANNQIHQNVYKEDVNISVRAVIGPPSSASRRTTASQGPPSSFDRLRTTASQGKKVGVATMNLGDGDGLKNLLKTITKKALDIAKASEEDPEFAGLPPAQVQSSKFTCKFKDEEIYSVNKVQSLKSVYESTVNFTAKDRAGAVSAIINKAKKSGLTAYGSLQNGLTEFVVANSNGVFSYHPVSKASLNIRVFKGPAFSLDPSTFLRVNKLGIRRGEERSGYAGYITTNISDIDFDKLACDAVRRATIGGKPIDIEPGDYEVILEEPAVSEMMQFLSYLGFGAKQFHEGSSFVSGRLGEKVLGENVTIFDDPFHAYTIPMPFDFEGMPKQKIPLVEKGVAKNIVYDNYYAKKHGKRATGHALPAPNTDGPFPFHINLVPGTIPKSELIKKVKNGILVTRFWYVNPIHPKVLNITGMTRDGTFLIKNGKIVAALRNLRFTQSIPEAMSNVLDIAKEVKAEKGGFGAIVVPALRIGKFHFTGASKL